MHEAGEAKATRHYTDGGLSSVSIHLPDGSVRVSETRHAFVVVTSNRACEGGGDRADDLV